MPSTSLSKFHKNKREKVYTLQTRLVSAAHKLTDRLPKRKFYSKYLQCIDFVNSYLSTVQHILVISLNFIAFLLIYFYFIRKQQIFNKKFLDDSIKLHCNMDSQINLKFQREIR